MTSRHYDVIVLGRSLGALASAALLARRDFRVLLLGQGSKGPTYRVEGHHLKRRAFTMLFGSSPAWLRIVHELAQTPTFRRRARPLDPMFVVASQNYRLEVPPDATFFHREIEREFPEVRQVVDELYSTFAEVNGAADLAFERDAVWPPGNLWERLETGRIAAGLPLSGAGRDVLLGKFPAGHPYRDIALLPALFATNLESASALPPFALARLHGAWTRGIQALEGGEDELEAFLVERIQAHGGICKLDQRATSIVVRHGAAHGVIEDGEEDVTGADNILSDQPGEVIAELSGGDGITKAARREWPRLTIAAGRFVVSLVVDHEGLPSPLGEEAFIVPHRRGPPDPRRPVIHLQRLPAQVEGESRPDAALLVAEILLPKRGTLTLLEARQAVLATLSEQLPFLEEHLRIVDSPHDGLPALDCRQGVRREIDRIHLRGAATEPEAMEWLWSVEPPGYQGIGAEPIRGPIPGTFLVGRTVLPALGQEGELLAAWGATRLVTRRDRTRQKMRRDMWSKIETN